MKNKFLSALTIALILFQAVAPIGALAWVGTDQADYAPGSVVTINGDTSDGAGYLAGEPVHVDVWGPNDYTAACEGTAEENGAWSCQVTLWNSELAVGDYTYTATGQTSGVSQSGTFTDANMTYSPPNVSLSTTPGGSVSFDQSVIAPKNNDSFTAALKVTGDISSWASASPTTLSFVTTSISSDTKTWTITIAVPTGTACGTYTGNVKANPPNPGPGEGSGTGVTLEVTDCAPSNTAPMIAANSASVTITEGATATNTGTWSEANMGDTVTLSASVGTVTKAGTNAGGTWSWSFGTTDGPAQSQTVMITVDDGTDTSFATFDLTVENAKPAVTASWASATVDCRKPATLNFGFSDAGVNDNPWTVDIDWDDSSSHYYDNAVAAQSTFSQSHTYNTQGTYTATVGVTDKDNGFGSNTATLNVLQTYTVKFLQPFDGSSPTSGLITNTMKSGRTVPVKVTIYDDCAQTYVTDPTAMVKIFLSTGTSTGTSNDAVEVYADAGASNGNTLYFRWTSDSSAPGGGFWIYNLDSKTALNGSPLAINTTYRIDIFVDSVKATATTHALLKPVK